jgi:PAS domain S-box-containing protein
LSRNRVRVVEDDEIVTIRIKNKLEEWGYEVIDIVNSGEEAVEKALLTRPDLILMDIVIRGELDGIDAANKINEFYKVPIIYLTAYEDSETVKRAKKTIPEAYILKPFADKKLKMALDVALCRHEMQKKLEDSERKYRNLFEHSINALALFQIIRDENQEPIDFIIIEVNPSFEKITGYNSSDIMERSILDIVPGFRAHHLFQIFAHIQPDSEPFREVQYSPLLKKHLDIGIFALDNDVFATVLVDITPYKKAESDLKSALQENNAFLREIHHRVNNNMQIISYFLSLQIKFMKDPDDKLICLQTKDRINSMAMVHEQLYSSQKISLINIRDYVESLVRQLVYTYAHPDHIKLNIDVDDLLFNLETAVPLGLILNELVTNCIRHAFPKGRKGVINIELKYDGARYHLCVEDDGVGFPQGISLENNHTIGLSLVKQLTLQMDGKIILEKDQGTCYTIEFLEQEYQDRILVSK